MFFKFLAALVVSAAVLFAFTFYVGSEEPEITVETGTTETTAAVKPETSPSETTVTVTPPLTPTVTPSPETSASSEPSETTKPKGPDYDTVKDVYVYAVWYDAVESNPVNYNSIESRKAFALKGVFYFSTPLSVSFEANLYKDDSVIMTREIKLNDNVTAEADFSAGLEGTGNFDTGDYYIELLYDGKPVANTSKMRVR